MAFDDTGTRHVAAGDDYFDRQAQSMDESGEPAGDPLDSEAGRAELRRLLQWYYYERERQAENRMEMATDADFYDSIQWDEEDAAALRARGQMPLVFNEVAPMVDWIIGTERRSRVDWSVLPRTEDDVDLADTKTKVLKYVADVNRSAFVRSRAFADAIKSGVGWVDDGARDDPTQDILYSKYEDWRNIVWDSAAYEHDLADARYVFRWRWVDEDVALMAFPQRAAAIRQAIEDAAHGDTDLDEDTTGFTAAGAERTRGGVLYAQGTGLVADAKRRRVKLIECQYKKPATVRVADTGRLQGAIFAPDDPTAQRVVDAGGSLIERVMMRVHVAVFTEAHLLSVGPSIYRHNRFSLTPVWCYRRGRDRLPYGVIRRVRDTQQDLNKRASKALFVLNTNQIIADEGAVEDWDEAREEADRPDGVIIKKPGKSFEIRRDTDEATGQMQMMTLDAQSIQKSAGVSDENLGRQTNATSGKAIAARQLQGSVVTTEPFDNLRLATQIQGEKQLALTEQFYSQAKAIRLTGTKGALEWVRINEPEEQPDGSVRVINDITASMADFVVSEQDYAGTMRQVMFENLNAMAAKLPPEVALRVLTIAMEFSDLPNKDEIADQIRKITGERDESKPLTPEEQAQAAQAAQVQAEALQAQREAAMLALQEQAAKVRELNAKAAKLEAEAMAAGAGDGEAQAAVDQVRRQAADELDRVSDQLRRAQLELVDRTLQTNREADTRLEVARIEADTKLRVVEIQTESDAKIAAMRAALDTAQAREDARAKAEPKPKEK